MANHSSKSYVECANETEGMVNVVMKNCLLQKMTPLQAFLTILKQYQCAFQTITVFIFMIFLPLSIKSEPAGKNPPFSRHREAKFVFHSQDFNHHLPFPDGND